MQEVEKEHQNVTCDNMNKHHIASCKFHPRCNNYLKGVLDWIFAGCAIQVLLLAILLLAIYFIFFIIIFKKSEKVLIFCFVFGSLYLYYEQ